jgi:undecaprenyl-phosphate 4-deoxy-4-formamido-L-arabinose transferase
VATLEQRGVSFEVVLVDDGSDDRTLELLRGVEAEDARVRVYELTRNFGQAAALACGLLEARGEVVVSLDADLQNPPEEIPALLDAIEKGAFIATGRRTQRHLPGWRLLGARSISWLANRLIRVPIQDYGGQFKAYRREVVEATRAEWSPGKPFFPLAVWLGFPVSELSVRQDPRAAGKSRYDLLSLVRVNIDLVTSFTTFPLALLGVLGLVGFALGALGVALCLVLGVSGWLAPAFSLALFGLGGVFLASGVLGLYVARIYSNVSGGRPSYVIRRGPVRDAPPTTSGSTRPAS